MEVKDLEKQINEKFADLKEQVEAKTSGVKADEFKELEQKHADLLNQIKESDQSESIEKMQKHLDQLDIKMQKNSGSNKESKSFISSLNDALTKNADHIKKMSDNKSESVNLQVKDMTIADNWTGDRAISDLDTQIASKPLARPVFRNLVNVGTTSGKHIYYIDKTSKGGAGMTGEGEMKSEVSYSYVEKSAEVKKITAFVKVSKEMLDDVSFLRSEINSDLRNELEAKLDEQIEGGDGLTVNMKGISTYAPTFDVAGTGYETSIQSANRADVLKVASAIVAANGFNANYAVVNPEDAALMNLEKNANGAYIMPPFYTAEGTRLAGMTLVENRNVDTGSFLVGDFTKSMLKIREEININLGYENDDFTKNMVTILGEMRAVHYIKDNHIDAFVKGDFATAITGIDEPAIDEPEV